MKPLGHIRIRQLSDHRCSWPTCLQSLLYHSEFKVPIHGNFIVDQNMFGLNVTHKTTLHNMLTVSSSQPPFKNSYNVWHLSSPQVTNASLLPLRRAKALKRQDCLYFGLLMRYPRLSDPG